MYHVVLAADTDAERAKQAANAIRSLPRSTEELEVTILDVFEEFDVADAGGRVRSEDVFDPENFSEGAVAAREELKNVDWELWAEHGDPS